MAGGIPADPFMVRQAHHERIEPHKFGYLAVRPEVVEGWAAKFVLKMQKK